jgi:hypothetical protein
MPRMSPPKANQNATLVFGVAVPSCGPSPNTEDWVSMFVGREEAWAVNLAMHPLAVRRQLHRGAGLG